MAKAKNKSGQSKVKKATAAAKKTKKAASKKVTAKKVTAKKVVAKAQPKTATQKPTAKPVTKLTAKAPLKSTVDYSKVVTPLGDRLVVRLVANERMTAGGLYIPDTVSNVQGHLKGEVLAAGAGNRSKKGLKRPLDVTVGDQIYFDQYSATKINFGLEELHIVKEIDVLGVAQ